MTLLCGSPPDDFSGIRRLGDWIATGLLMLPQLSAVIVCSNSLHYRSEQLPWDCDLRHLET
jgi:hypothetical protein